MRILKNIFEEKVVDLYSEKIDGAQLFMLARRSHLS